MFGFMILIFYSARFISKLSLILLHTPIKNLEDVSRLKTHRLCLRDTSYGLIIMKEHVSINQISIFK